MVAKYARRRVVLHNTAYVYGCGNKVGRDHNDNCGGYHGAIIRGPTLLGEQCRVSYERINYAMENYHWIWEREVLADLLAHLRSRGLAPDQLVAAAAKGTPLEDGFLFFEETYYEFVGCYPDR